MSNNKQRINGTGCTFCMVDGEVTLPLRDDCLWRKCASRSCAVVMLPLFGPDTCANITGTKVYGFVSLICRYFEGYNYWNFTVPTTIGHQDCVVGIICILPGLLLMPCLAVFTDEDTAKMGFLTVAALLPFLFQSRERLDMEYHYVKRGSLYPGFLCVIHTVFWVLIVWVLIGGERREQEHQTADCRSQTLSLSRG